MLEMTGRMREAMLADLDSVASVLKTMPASDNRSARILELEVEVERLLVMDAALELDRKLDTLRAQLRALDTEPEA